MSRIVIVPTDVSDAINAKLDVALAACPQAAPDRAQWYGEMLAYFDEHGTVPDFSIVPVRQ